MKNNSSFKKKQLAENTTLQSPFFDMYFVQKKGYTIVFKHIPILMKQ